MAEYSQGYGRILEGSHHQQVIRAHTEEEGRVMVGRENALMNVARGLHAGFL